MDWWFWALLVLLLALIGVFLYLRNQRPSDD
jgi:hypothetical protein